MQSFFERPLFGLVMGTVVGAAVALAMYLNDFGESSDPGSEVAAQHDPAGAAAFLVAWERRLSSTWAVEYQYARTLPDGREFGGSSFEAQRPPKRIRNVFGSVRAETNDTQFLCSGSTDQTTTLTCRRNGSLPPFGERVMEELADIRPLVEGDTRKYDVTSADGCFRLDARPSTEPLPWGSAARFCFDDTNGAPLEVSTLRNGVGDSYVATSVNPNPPESVFELPLPAT